MISLVFQSMITFANVDHVSSDLLPCFQGDLHREAGPALAKLLHLRFCGFAIWVCLN